MQDKTYKIVRFYVIGTIFLGLFFYMNNADWLQPVGVAEKTESSQYSAIMALIMNLFKFILLVLGTGIPAIMTIFVIREKFRKK